MDFYFVFDRLRDGMTETLPALSCRPQPRAMRACECAGLSFHEIACRIEAEGLALDEVLTRTGCGRTCTACVPDLRAFLANRSARSER